MYLQVDAFELLTRHRQLVPVRISGKGDYENDQHYCEPFDDRTNALDKMLLAPGEDHAQSNRNHESDKRADDVRPRQ